MKNNGSKINIDAGVTNRMEKEIIKATGKNTPSTAGPIGINLVFFAAIAGLITALVAVRTWLPGLSASLLGQDKAAFWYISRAFAIVSYFLLWINMTLGVGITGKLAQVWPGVHLSSDIHAYLGILGLVFSAAHGLILLGDNYLNFSLLQILIPFSSYAYRPFWVGIGQLGIYLWGIVYFSNYIKSKMGKKSWRIIHYASFIVFLAIVLHGIMAGTDTASPWMIGVYWSTLSIFLTAVFYRIIVNVKQHPQIHNSNPPN